MGTSPEAVTSVEPAATDEARVTVALNLLVLRSTKYVAWGGAALFVLAIPIDFASLPEPNDRIVPIIDAVVAGALLMCGWFANPLRVGPQRAHQLLATAILVVLLNGAVVIYLVQDPVQTGSAALAALALGLLAFNWGWFIALTLLTTLSWIVPVGLIGFTPEWIQAGIVLAGAILISSVTHAVRLSTYRRLERFRIENEQNQAELAAAVRRARNALAATRSQEERFQRLSESGFEGVLLHSGGRILDANQALAEIVGRTPAQLRAAHATELFDEDTASVLRSRLLDHGPDPFEGNARRPDGRLVPVEVRARQLPGGEGPAEVLVVRDLTDRRRAERISRLAAERQHEIERLRELNEFKTRFINEVSHQFNTPLTPITIQLERLRGIDPASQPEEWGSSLEILERNVGRLQDIVKEVLAIARIQAGTLGLARRPTDLASVAAEAARRFRAAAEAAGIRLATDLPSVPSVAADADRLGEVLDHLLDNALKWTPRGGLVILSCRADPDGPTLRVQDSGPGIPPAEAKQLFQPLPAVGESAAPAAGPGLGLYLSRLLVELHGGHIWHEPVPGAKGSVFAIRLPLAPSDT